MKGWIYLRKDPGRGYAIGKTTNERNRERNYRKENPHIVTVDTFYTHDIDAAESELIVLIRSISLFPGDNRRNEWAKWTDAIFPIWNDVKRRHQNDSYAKEQARLRAAKAEEAKRREAEKARHIALEQERRKQEQMRRELERAAENKKWLTESLFRSEEELSQFKSNDTAAAKWATAACIFIVCIIAFSVLEPTLRITFGFQHKEIFVLFCVTFSGLLILTGVAYDKTKSDLEKKVSKLRLKLEKS